MQGVDLILQAARQRSEDMNLACNYLPSHLYLASKRTSLLLMHLSPVEPFDSSCHGRWILEADESIAFVLPARMISDHLRLQPQRHVREPYWAAEIGDGQRHAVQGPPREGPLPRVRTDPYGRPSCTSRLTGPCPVAADPNTPSIRSQRVLSAGQHLDHFAVWAKRLGEILTSEGVVVATSDLKHSAALGCGMPCAPHYEGYSNLSVWRERSPLTILDLVVVRVTHYAR